VLLADVPLGRTQWNIQQKQAYREEARSMFYHGYNAYMQHGYPWDELRPLTCKERRWDRRERGTLDDILGGFSLTLVDSLDMLAVLDDRHEFQQAVTRVIEIVRFDRNVTVSLFETTIRVLGGMLSAHSLLVGLEWDQVQQLPNATRLAGADAEPERWYHGELLEMSADLGERLLPAFDTPSGIPYHRINLEYGVPAGEDTDTCTAGAGTLQLEFGLLSRFTGDDRFEQAANKAVRKIWSERSKLNLVGSAISVRTGKWTQQHASIGAGVDSFYEYLLKTHILFGDAEWLEMATKAYDAVNYHLRRGDWYAEANMHQGAAAMFGTKVSALSAFWPGMPHTIPPPLLPLSSLPHSPSPHLLLPRSAGPFRRRRQRGSTAPLILLAMAAVPRTARDVRPADEASGVLCERVPSAT
jgi:hypothetical protein